jgi:hypothetical protein
MCPLLIHQIVLFPDEYLHIIALFHSVGFAPVYIALLHLVEQVHFLRPNKCNLCIYCGLLLLLGCFVDDAVYVLVY